MRNLKIEYLPVDSLRPYEKNARNHAEKDVSAIVASIKEFGFNDPIGIWSEKNIIVEGHGRLLAAKQLGISKVPCIRLDELTDEQRWAYALAHNKTAELSTWDETILESELEEISIDMSEFGFVLTEEEEEQEKAKKYTGKANIPQYEPTGEFVTLADCYNVIKRNSLLEEIEQTDGITDEERQFLREAANRHISFNYRNIAEYYASASAEMQKLMEKSALVIIDMNDAIAYGYARLAESIKQMQETDGGSVG